MTAELASVPEYDGPVADLSVLARWALDARQAHLVAQSLATTSFVPDSMRGKPDEITAAILTGQEIGLEPMSALRSIDVINGTPAMRAHALRGLVQSRGHEVWVKESSTTRAVVCGRRKGSTQEQKSTWTIDRARSLNLAGKKNWKEMPESMLIARATAECCRLTASDVILGMPYATEELDDDASVNGSPASTPSRRTARRKPVAQIEAPEPALSPEPITEEEPEAEPDEAPAVEVAEHDHEYGPDGICFVDDCQARKAVD